MTRVDIQHNSMPWRRSSYGCLLAVVLLEIVLLAGCASHVDQLVTARKHYYAGRLSEADEALAESLEKTPKDASVLKLDQAMIRLSQGEPRQAEQLLRQVRDDFDHLQQTSLGEEALAMIGDETDRAYSGEAYERILIRTMLALSSLCGDGVDADAYALQIEQEQRKTMESLAAGQEVDPRFQVAIGPYVRGLLAESTHARFDDAARNYQKVVHWQPTFDAGRADLDRALSGRHSQQGNGVVYVIGLVGRGPYKEVVPEHPTSNALLIADRILSATGKHTLPPTIAPIQVPRVVRAPNSIDRLRVSVDSEPVGETSTVTDVTALAIAQGESEIDKLVGRAVARRVIKKAVVYTAKDATRFSDNVWLNLAMDAAGVVWEATETADTRCWGLLPDTIQVLRVELPAGDHTMSLQPATGLGPKGTVETITVPVSDGRNTYVLANFPSERLAGQISVSTR